MKSLSSISTLNCLASKLLLTCPCAFTVFLLSFHLSMSFLVHLLSCPLEEAFSKALRMNCSNGNTNTVCPAPYPHPLHSTPTPHYCLCVCQSGQLLGPNLFHSELEHTYPTSHCPFLHVWCDHSCRSQEIGESKETSILAGGLQIKCSPTWTGLHSHWTSIVWSLSLGTGTFHKTQLYYLPWTLVFQAECCTMANLKGFFVNLYL